MMIRAGSIALTQMINLNIILCVYVYVYVNVYIGKSVPLLQSEFWKCIWTWTTENSHANKNYIFVKSIYTYF